MSRSDPKVRKSRRQFLQMASVAAAGLATGARAAAPAAPTASDGSGTAEASVGQGPRSASKTLTDGVIGIEFDGQLRSRLWNRTQNAVLLTSWAPTESLELADGTRVEDFELRQQTDEKLTLDSHGRVIRHRLIGEAGKLEKTVEIDLFERYPGVAVYRVSYRNTGSEALAINRWTNSAVRLLRDASPPAQEGQPEFWSYCGSTHADRRDWVQPVTAGFSQDNFMGMSASDYGGGTPIVDVWRRDCGLAMGHLSTSPLPLSLPVRHADTGVEMSISGDARTTLKPGERLEIPPTFVATHRGDYFAVLDRYRQFMADVGLQSPSSPEAAYEPIWCAWGYERECTKELIEGTLPKVRDLGLRWAVIDDGWQSNVGDWKLSPAKYPNGEADMKALVSSIRAEQLKPRLWFAPLAAAPGSDVLHDHTDMLLLDKDGAVQNISWWNCFYLCPAYEETVKYTQALVRKFLSEWGHAGLKIDGQHLNAVAPCYNPAHRHSDPWESARKLPDFFQAIYRTALEIDPQAVVELCPCGTSYSFFNFRSLNQAPASDPESSWQVRHKGKTLKALMGASAAFAGDHVELSDGHDDFASTVGIGGIVSTKFTWPRDPKPKDSFLLTPERERLWRKWISLYNEHQLPHGIYRGELYDIGFDRPETHVVEKSGRLYYALYAPRYSGPFQLRGLENRRYRVRDYFNDKPFPGAFSRRHDRLTVGFDRFLLLEAVPA